MAYSRRATLGVAAGTGLLVAVGLVPAMAGSAAPAQAAGCSATASVKREWGSGSTGGQILSVRVVNTSATTATAWTVSWPLAAGQRIVSAWNSVATAAGGTATVHNARYNGTLPPAAAATFGMLLAGTGAAPTVTCDNGTETQTCLPPASQPAPTPDVTVGPPPDGLVLTANLFVGQTVEVWTGRRSYGYLEATGTAIEPIWSTGGYSTGQPIRAVFRAVAVGKVDVVESMCGDPKYRSVMAHINVLPEASRNPSPRPTA